MTRVLKLAALAVLLGGLLAEHGRLIPAPGFALLGGALVAIYLWILAKARQQLRPRV